jgi:hypothetical protein
MPSVSAKRGLMMGTKRWELFLPVYKRNGGGQIEEASL